jgi:hypothetical protein
VRESWFGALIEAIARGIQTHAPNRTNPRRIKRRTKHYLPRTGFEPLNRTFDPTPLIVRIEQKDFK